MAKKNKSKFQKDLENNDIKVAKTSADIIKPTQLDGSKQDMQEIDTENAYTLLQFRAEVSKRDSRHVVDYFKKLVQQGMLLNPNACGKELKRLGYALELEQAKVVIKDNE